MSCKVIQRLGRVKKLDKLADEGGGVKTSLKRCLNTLDITLLGVGHMMGSGIYVLTCALVHSVAGPATVVSYFVAGVASFLAALAYAEFGVRFPLAGSAYSYVYFSVGEFWAYVVGWNVVLEHVIGIAAVTRSCSAYINALTKNRVHSWFISVFGVVSEDEHFSKYFDFLAVALIISYVVYMSCGVKSTSWLNNILCGVNIGILLVIIVVGFQYATLDNWRLEGQGFMPFGFAGVLKASASCFFAYIGFDSIAASGEEAKTPAKSLPIATFASMFIVAALYMLTSAVLSLMTDFRTVDNDTGIPNALAANGAYWAQYVVTVGALCGMSTVAIGTTFALTRSVYAMAEDGLLFKIFAHVNSWSHVPLVAMWTFTSLSAILALLINIETLVNMMSIGTLTAYLVVSAGIVIHRYRLPEDQPSQIQHVIDMPVISNKERCDSIQSSRSQRLRPYFASLEDKCCIFGPRLVTICISIITILTFAIGFYVQNMDMSEWNSILLVVVAVLLILFCVFTIAIHKEVDEVVPYKMPLLPYLPILSVIIDAFLMTTLELLNWLRLLCWVGVGLLIYFGYGIRHSKLNQKQTPATNKDIYTPQL